MEKGELTEMSESTENKKKIGKKGIIIIAIVALLLIAGLIIFFLFRGKIRATTMRLLRLEGTVSMEENGREKAVKENLRLKSGNALNTEIESLVSIGLDDAKVVTMNETSRAEFTQKGKYLDLNLTKGSLFFEVDKPLEDDETFEIRTSTMVVGIRGTSGYVSVEGGIEELIITDGHVHVIGTNPVTKEVKEADVYAGQRLRVYLYNDRKVDSIMFELEDITERQLPEFVLRMLRENPTLLDKVIKATGWDKPWILGLTDDEQGEGSDAESSDNTEAANAEGNSEGNGDQGEGSGQQDENNTTETEKIKPEDNTDDTTDNNTDNAQPPEQTELQKEMEAAKAAIAQTNQDGTITLNDGTVFEPGYYAAKYPDVVATYGTDPTALLAHYVTYGKAEGRLASQAEENARAAAWNQQNNENNNNNTTTNTTPANTTPASTTNVVQANGSITFADGSTGTYDAATGQLTINSAGSGTTATLPATITDQNGNTVNVSLNNVNVAAGITSVNASATNANVGELVNFVAKNPSVASVNNSTTTVNPSASGVPTATVQTGTAGIAALANSDLSALAGGALGSITFGSNAITYDTASTSYTINNTASATRYVLLTNPTQSGDSVVFTNPLGSGATTTTLHSDGSIT